MESPFDDFLMAILCDFVAGDTISIIAKRYRVDENAAEWHVRRALVEYGFSQYREYGQK
jgi:5-hydroxyisourate hydrolase-like protein (transthyretin family)